MSICLGHIPQGLLKAGKKLGNRQTSSKLYAHLNFV